MPGLIRREQFTPLQTLSLIDIQHEADQALARAQREAADILAAARTAADEILNRRREEAHAAGLAEGRRSGEEAARAEARATALQQAKAEVDELAATLRTGITAFDRAKARLLAEAETGLIELALAIAQRVCKHVARSDIEVARQNAVQLLDMMRNAGDLELCVHPAQHEALRHSVQQFLDESDRHEHVAVIADSAVGSGECVLRSRDGEIDARIQSQLDAIAEALVPPRAEKPAKVDGAE